MYALLQAWSIIDKLYDLFNNLDYVNKQQKNIFRVKLIKYRGSTLVLSDKTVISSGDLVLKIHLHNCLLQREMRGIDNEVKRAFYVHQRVQQSLPDLAKYVINHPQKESIKGLIGITLLTRGVKKLGFEVKDIQNDFYRIMKQMYLVPMFAICHSQIPAPFQKGGSMLPKFLIMSKQALFEKYLEENNHFNGE